MRGGVLHLVVGDGERDKFMTPRTASLEPIARFRHERHQPVVIGTIELVDVDAISGGGRIAIELLVEPGEGYPRIRELGIETYFVGVDALVLAKLLLCLPLVAALQANRQCFAVAESVAEGEALMPTHSEETRKALEAYDLPEVTYFLETFMDSFSLTLDELK